MAVSGGADSFALLHHLVREGCRVVALTVDHGLRPESAAEAQRVHDWCAEHDVSHETLVWHGDKPETGIQEAARNARYRLLASACNRLGVEWLVTGHTADDQAETVFMRLRRGAGRGLASMSPTRVIAAGAGEPITLGRPLLAVRRQDTRAYATAHTLPFHDDPSNDDPAFERVRVRALLAALEEQNLLTTQALCRTAGEVARLTDDAALRLNRHKSDFETTFQGDGALIAFNSDWFDDAVPDVVDGQHNVRYLQKAVSAIADGDTHTIPLMPRDGESSAGGGVSLFLKSGELQIYREPAALLGRADGTPPLAPITVAPGERHLFDRRFIVTIPEDIAAGTALRALGQLIPRDIATSTVDRQRFSTLPCLARGDTITHLPAGARHNVHSAFQNWKLAQKALPLQSEFPCESLLPERFEGKVIRF